MNIRLLISALFAGSLVSSVFAQDRSAAPVDPNAEVYELKKTCDQQILIVGEPDPANPGRHIGRLTWNPGHEQNCAAIAEIYPTTPNGLAEAKAAAELQQRIKQEEVRRAEVDRVLAERFRQADVAKLKRQLARPQ